VPLEIDMTRRTPPRLATSLLEKLGSPDRCESLIGDLTEQYQRGSSSIWFWRQSLMAIIVGAARDLRRDTGQVMHALLTGLGALLLYWQVSDSLYMGLGYLAGQSHWSLDTFWLTNKTIFFPLGFIGGVVAGRFVVRFHRPQLAACLLVLITTWIAIDLPSLLRLIRAAPVWWSYPAYRYQLIMNLGKLLCLVLGTFVGGLSKGTLPSRRTTSNALVP
jgi:hypothetical protein